VRATKGPVSPPMDSDVSHCPTQDVKPRPDKVLEPRLAPLCSRVGHPGLPGCQLSDGRSIPATPNDTNAANRASLPSCQPKASIHHCLHGPYSVVHCQSRVAEEQRSFPLPRRWQTPRQSPLRSTITSYQSVDPMSGQPHGRYLPE